MTTHIETVGKAEREGTLVIYVVILKYIASRNARFQEKYILILIASSTIIKAYTEKKNYYKDSKLVIIGINSYVNRVLVQITCLILLIITVD